MSCEHHKHCGDCFSLASLDAARSEGEAAEKANCEKLLLDLHAQRDHWQEEAMTAYERGEAAGRAKALQQAAEIAAGWCRCKPYWKPYGRIDPDCHAHDIEGEGNALSRLTDGRFNK